LKIKSNLERENEEERKGKVFPLFSQHVLTYVLIIKILKIFCHIVKNLSNSFVEILIFVCC